LVRRGDQHRAESLGGYSPVFDTTAAAVFDEPHDALALTFCVVESDSVASAVSWLVWPTPDRIDVPVTTIAVAERAVEGATGVEPDDPHAAAPTAKRMTATRLFTSALIRGRFSIAQTDEAGWHPY
jgi:hypothetical protein